MRVVVCLLHPVLWLWLPFAFCRLPFANVPGIQAYSFFFGAALGLLVLFLMYTVIGSSSASSFEDTTILTLIMVLSLELLLSAFLLAMIANASAANAQQSLQYELLLAGKLRAQRRLLQLESSADASAVSITRLRCTIDIIASAASGACCHVARWRRCGSL